MNLTKEEIQQCINDAVEMTNGDNVTTVVQQKLIQSVFERLCMALEDKKYEAQFEDDDAATK